MIDIRDDTAFAGRKTHKHDIVLQQKAMQHIARAFVEQPETILRELVNAAVELCGADSSGISLEKEDRTDAAFYHWVATAGEYTAFMNAVLPRYPSACGICLERNRPQLFRVSKPFFDLLGVEAPLVTDGILLPWEVDETRGTIFIMAHGRTEAFDQEDCRVIEMLADFAAIGVRQLRQQKKLMEQSNAAAAAEMANRLAHKINNPLQALTNILYLAGEGQYGDDAIAVGQQTFHDLQKLSILVKELLAIPYAKES